MKKSYLILFSVLTLSSIIYSQGKSSIQFSGGTIHPISSDLGLSGTLQYNYNINTTFNFYISTAYSVWDRRNFNYIDKTTTGWTERIGASETNHSLSSITIGGRYLITPLTQFKLFVDAGIGYSYLQYDDYYNKLFNIPDGTTEILSFLTGIAHQNLFSFSSGFGIIHPITERWDILFDFKVSTYLNSQYYGLFSSKSTFSSFQFGFNYKI